MIIDSPIISGSNAASGSFNQFGNINVTGSLTVSSSTFTANNNVILGTDSSNTVVVNSTIDSDIVPYEGGTRNLGSNSTKWDNVYSNAFTGSLFGTSSFALTASYATNAGAGAGFPFSGSAQITGSLLITELSGSGVRYLTTDNDGLIIAQTASAAIKTTQAVTSTAGQTSFNITNGYTTGLVDVFINGTKLSASEFTDTSGTVITLATGSNDGDTVEFVKYFPASGVTNNALRQLTTFTASAGQTVFSASYTPGLLDIYYNGARLSTSDYTANNGTYFTLATASAANDILDVLVYSYQVGAFSGIGGQGVTSQIAYFNTTSSITGSNNFTISGSTMTVTGSLLVSGSGTFTNIGPAVMSGSLNVSGAIVTNSTITAQTLVVQTITSSVSVITGSTNWGSLSSNTHTFTGSMYVTGALYVATGSVGMGITSPNYNLQLHNPSSSDTRFQITNTTTGTGGAVGIQLITFGNDAVLTNRSNGYFVFETNSTERMRITSGGNVGINTTLTTSNYKLGVSGSAYINGSNNKGIFITDNATYTSIVGINSAISSYNPLELRASGTDYQLYLTTDGRVGIGASSPSQNLTVLKNQNADTAAGIYNQTDGTASSTTLRLDNGSYNGQLNLYANSYTTSGTATANALRLYTDGPGGMNFSATNNHIRFYTSPSEVNRLTILYGGNVGIGNANPPQLFTLYSAGSTIMRFQSGGATTDHWDAFSNTLARFYIWNVSTNNGAYLVYNSSSGWTSVSDARWKTNWTDLGPSLSLINQLKIGRYKMLDKDKQPVEGARWDYGVKAQELLEIIPDAVDVPDNPEDKYGVINNIVFYHAIKAIQEQQSLITSLQTRIEQLENK